MPQRFSCKSAAVVQGGTTFAHTLSSTPDEWAFNLKGPGPGAAALYLTGAPDATNVIIAASGADGTCDLFAWVNHSIVQ